MENIRGPHHRGEHDFFSCTPNAKPAEPESTDEDSKNTPPSRLFESVDWENMFALLNESFDWDNMFASLNGTELLQTMEGP